LAIVPNSIYNLVKKLRNLKKLKFFDFSTRIKYRMGVDEAMTSPKTFLIYVNGQSTNWLLDQPVKK